MAKVVKATFIRHHPEDFGGMNEEWVRWFPTDPRARPGASRHLTDAGHHRSPV
jgi:2-iminobutanoate/2-iminopropanoate deaminase